MSDNSDLATRYSLISGVIFDFDDTLLATFESRAPCLIEAAQRFGYTISVPEIRRYWGAPFRELIFSVVPEVDYGIFYDLYKEVMLQHPPIVQPGTAEILGLLRAKSIRTAIVSSSSKALVEQDLNACGLLEFIQFIQGYEDSDYFKPDGRVLLPTLAWMRSRGIQFQNCVSIGDSIKDYFAATTNQITFFAVLTGSSTKEDFLENGLAEKFIFNSLLDLALEGSTFHASLSPSPS
ncbi:MAG: hypothetical protein B6D41_00955 [Chloroflexi bacterium UTCFX4]|jgi:phosphoglycolate phosphatase-like HAD superfamily hydrolase|nr:MAG: hypothetical protein B6D41_00955 [Chloroflexi bacterium UTCFX4]